MRPERIQIAKDVGEMLTSAEYLYFVTYKGLKVKDMDQFRTKLAAVGAQCHVLKNRIVRKVAELNGLVKCEQP